MNKGIINISVSNKSSNNSITTVRASYSRCADDKDNIIEVTKARLNP